MNNQRLPEGWKKIRLMDVSESISAGGTPRRNKKEFWNNGTIPWLKISDMKNKYISKTEEKITKEGLEKSSAKLFPKGTLVYSIFATLGAIGILDIDATTNQAIAGINPKDDIIDTKYLYYCLKSERKNIIAKKSHATQDNLNLGILKNHEIPVPPIPIQKNIVVTLEKAEQLKQWRYISNFLTDYYLNSIFLKMFGDPNKNKKKWDIITINDGLKNIKYGTSSPPRFSQEGFAFIRATNIKNGRIIKNDMKYINEEEGKKIEKCKLNDGDIIIVRSGVNTSDCAVISDKYVGCYAGYDLILEMNKDVLNPYFLNQLLNLDTIKMKLKILSRRAGQPHLNSKQISTFSIIKPPITLQNKFADIIKQFESLSIYQKKSQDQIDNYFSTIMQKAFRGELVC
jgi:type I restriction enzyme S subunit